jgi:hypothetical protein
MIQRARVHEDDFRMIHVRALERIASDPALGVTELRLLLSLVGAADRYGRVTITIPAMMKRIGKSRAVVAASLSKLRMSDLVERRGGQSELWLSSTFLRRPVAAADEL